MIFERWWSGRFCSAARGGFVGPLLALLAGCSSYQYEEGVTLEIQLAHATRGPTDGDRTDEGSAREVVTSEGLEVSVQRAGIALGPLELLACDRVEPLAGALAMLHRALVPVAHAHELDSPLIYPTPIAVDLMGAESALGPPVTMTPPPGSYCGLRIGASIADEHASGIAAFPDMLGRSLIVSGRHTAPGAAIASEFTFASTLMEHVRVAFHRPIELRPGGGALVVLLELDDRDLLDGVDFTSDNPALQELQIIRNLLHGLQLHPCESESCSLDNG